MTHIMKGEWARQNAVAGVRSAFTARFDLYTSRNVAGSSMDQLCDNRGRG